MHPSQLAGRTHSGSQHNMFVAILFIVLLTCCLICILYHAAVIYFIAMYTAGDSGSITCTLNLVLNYTWSDEDGNTVVNGDELHYSANDSLHHKSFLCSGQNLLTRDTETLNIKFVVNGNSS